MEAGLDEAYSLASLAHNAFGDAAQASMYASLAISYGIFINGPEWRSYDSYALLAQEPERHWSYKCRLPGGSAGPKPAKKIEANKDSKPTALFSIVNESN